MFDVRLIIISLKYIQKNPFQIKKTHITQTAQKRKIFFFKFLRTKDVFTLSSPKWRYQKSNRACFSVKSPSVKIVPLFKLGPIWRLRHIVWLVLEIISKNIKRFRFLLSPVNFIFYWAFSISLSFNNHIMFQTIK